MKSSIESMCSMMWLLSCSCVLCLTFVQVRGLAKAKAPAGEILAACDRVRDDTLPELGVRLEDRPDGEGVLGEGGCVYNNTCELVLVCADSDGRKGSVVS
jgi:hypothetical protein